MRSSDSTTPTPDDPPGERAGQDDRDDAAALLRLVIRHTPVILFAVDREGTITASEGRGLHLLGSSPGQDVGRSVHEVYRDAPALGQSVLRALAGEEHSAVVELRGLVFEAHLVPARQADGRITGVIATATDVTERQRAQDRQAILADVVPLLSISLDYAAALADLGRFLVGRLCDWCSIYLLEEGAFRQVALLHRDPDRTPLLHELERRRPIHTWPTIRTVIQTQEPHLHQEVPDALVRAEARTEQAYQMARAIGVRSGMTVPMAFGGRVYGVITLVRGSPGCSYEPADVVLARSIAERAALAIENAQLYQKVRESEERLRLVIASAPIALFAVDSRGIFTLSEGQALAALGLRPGELVGQSIFELYSKGPEAPAKLRRAMAGELTTDTGCVQGRWFEVRLSPLRDASGTPTGVTGVSVDVTERRLAEQRLSCLAEAGRILMESIDCAATLPGLARLLCRHLADWCGIFVLDGDSLRALGVAHADPDKDALLRELLRRYPVGPPGQGALLAVLRSGQAALSQEITEETLRSFSLDEELIHLLREDLGLQAGLLLPMSVHGRVLGVIALLSAGPGRRFEPADVAVAEEVAGRVALALSTARLYREEQRAVRTREEMISIASHEIRAPLNALHMQLQMPLHQHQRGLGLLSKEQLLSALDAGFRHARHMARLVDRLLDVTRLASGQLQLLREPMDLCEAVREVAARMSGELAAEGYELVVRADAPVVGRWDRTRLEEVITNLLSNAMKYGRGRPIEVRVERAGQLGRLVVVDQGIGIAREHQGRIFERFERATTEGAHRSLGLGLYIVREIVSGLGGAVRVQSELDQGATFIVELPGL